MEENCEKFEIKFEIKLEQKLWKNEENFGEKLSKKFEKVEKVTLLILISIGWLVQIYKNEFDFNA